MYIESGIIGVIVGAAGTVIGGLIAMLIGRRVTEPRPFLAFAGGMMIAVMVIFMCADRLYQPLLKRLSRPKKQTNTR